MLVSCSGGGGGGSSPPPASTNVASSSNAGNPAPVQSNINRQTVNNGRAFAFDLFGMRASASAAVAGNSLEETLVQCTVTLRDGQECNLDRLPLLGMTTTAPTVADVMARVLTSHPWMGVRFRQLLQVLPSDMLLLMRGVTGIVISHDIRPSFYTTQTGAIYLDPASLWLTPSEQADIDTAPDYRSAYGSDLKFTMLWRYVLNNQSATSAPTEGTRSLSDIKFRVAALLYHELAHANDYFGVSRQPGLDRSLPIVNLSGGVISSSRLGSRYPLGSSVMFSVARVSFLGQSANAQQRALQPTDIEFEFTGDFASDYYNYSTQREDFAMAFEEAMMLFNFGVDRDVAITNRPADNFCSQYIVTWGQRNRVTDPAVINRSIFSVEEILPEISNQVELVLRAQDPPTLMTPGRDWCENIQLDNAPRALSGVRSGVNEPVELVRPYL